MSTLLTPDRYLRSLSMTWIDPCCNKVFTVYGFIRLTSEAIILISVLPLRKMNRMAMLWEFFGRLVRLVSRDSEQRH